jgi:hypothetical protein
MSELADGAKLHQGTIVLLEAGKQVPEDFAQLACERNNACIGVAIAIPESKEVIPATDTRRPAAEYFVGSRAAYENCPMVFFLGNSPKGFHRDDIMPFVLLTKGKTSEGKDKPTVCVLLDGDFSPYHKADSSHSEHYLFAHEFLKPKIEKLNKIVSGDLDKLAEAIKDSEDDILARDIPTGIVVFVLGNGKIVRMTKKYDSFRDTSFGFTSDTYGWIEKAQAPQPTAPEAPASGNFFDRITKPVTEAVAAVVKTVVPTPPAAATTVKPPEVTEKRGTPYVMLACPGNVRRKGDIKAWYIAQALTGAAPSKWHERPKVPCKVPANWKQEILYMNASTKEQTTVKSFSELPAPPAQPAAAPASSPLPPPPGSSPQPDTQPAPAVPPASPAPAAPVPEQKPGDADLQQAEAAEAGDYEFPVVDDTERKGLEEKILLFQDENKSFVQDPRAMQEWVERRETFAEAMGLQAVPDFTPAFLEDMFDNFPVAFFTWSMDQWTAAKIAQARVAELEARIAQLDQPGAKPADTATSSASPLPPPPGQQSRLRKSA